MSERPLLPAETQSALMANAGGNPLYAEQYVRMLAEREPTEDLPVPESVQGIIAARLDALPPEEKALLQDAAVVGKVFWLGALDQNGNRSDLQRRLHALERKEFIQRARRATVAGETEFAFKHLLVRDVAYGQIPRAERAEKHGRAAGWIESLGRPEDHAEMVAHHYLSAIELARAAGQDVGELAARAKSVLREAGDRAVSLSALPQAEHYYGEALALLSADDPERPELLFRQGRVRFDRVEEGDEEIQAARDAFLAAGNRERAAEAALILADIAWRRGSGDGVLAHLDNARSLVAGTQPSRIQTMVLAEASRYEMLADQNNNAIELGYEALRMAEELGLDDLRAHALNNIGSARGNAGDREGLAQIEESIAIATRVNAIASLLRGHNNLASMQTIYGELKAARAGVDETRRLGEHFGHLGFVRFIDGGPGLGNRYTAGDWDGALERAVAFVAEVEGGAPHYQAANAYVYRGLIELARGDARVAESDAERAVEAGRRAGDPQVWMTTSALGAFIYAVAGDERRADQILAEVFAGLREVPHLGFALVEAPIVAWLASMLGREDEVDALFARETIDSPWLGAGRAVAAGDFREAADILGEMDARTQEAFFRLRSAEQLVGEGRRKEADEQLHLALAFFRSVGGTRYVREGEALLAATG